MWDGDDVVFGKQSMFEITVEQNQYKTYVLSDREAQSSMTVVPERGGIIIGWQIQEHELFYLDTERFKDSSLSIRGGIPLLFPICGNLPDDTYTLNGQSYALKQHGFGRTSPWEVTEQSTDDNAMLTVTLKSTEATRSLYPFDFELNYSYILKGNMLELRQRHTNLSQTPMPFSTGIHPYFAVHDKTQLSFSIPSTQYQVKGDPELLTFSGQFDFEQDEIDFAFVNLTDTVAQVTDMNRQLRLTVEYDSCYSTLVFWTLKGKDFYCLEPWSGPRNAMNTGNHLLTVAPGETVETVITMRMEALAN